MSDMTDRFEFHEASMAYMDGPQEGYLIERATGVWHRFRCLRVAQETWVWLVVAAEPPTTETELVGFDTASWAEALVFLETNRPTGNVIEEFRRCR